MSEENKVLEVLWSPRQLSKYLGVHITSVHRWLSQKRVIDPAKVVRIGRRVRIPRSEVERIAGIRKEELKSELKT